MNEQMPAVIRATEAEWREAWDTFNAGLKKLNELARRDDITIRLSATTVGQVKKVKRK